MEGFCVLAAETSSRLRRNLALRFDDVKLNQLAPRAWRRVALAPFRMSAPPCSYPRLPTAVSGLAPLLIHSAS